MALTPFSDNLETNAPKVLDNKNGRFSAGKWRPYNDVAEYLAAYPILASRAWTQQICVLNATDATKADIYMLDSNKTPYKVVGGVEVAELIADLAQEIADREAGDLTNANAISAETTRAIGVENTKANSADIFSPVPIVFADLTTSTTYTNTLFADQPVLIEYKNPTTQEFANATFNSSGVLTLPFTAVSGFTATLIGSSGALGKYVANYREVQLFNKDVTRVRFQYIGSGGVITNSIYSATSWSGYIDVSGVKNFTITGIGYSLVWFYNSSFSPISSLPIAGIKNKADWPVGAKYIGIDVSANSGSDYSETISILAEEGLIFPEVKDGVKIPTSWTDLGESIPQTIFNISAPTMASVFFAYRDTATPALQLIRFVSLEDVSYEINIPLSSVPVTKTLFIYRKYRITETERTYLSTHTLTSGLNTIQKTGTETHFSIQSIYNHPTDLGYDGNFNLTTESTINKVVILPALEGMKPATLLDNGDKLSNAPIIIKDGIGWNQLQNLERWNVPKGIVNSSGNLTISPTSGVEKRIRCLWAVELPANKAFKIVLPKDKFPSNTLNLRLVKKIQSGTTYTNVGSIITLTESETIIEKTGAETHFCVQIVWISSSNTTSILQSFDILSDGMLFVAEKDSEGNVPKNYPEKIVTYEGIDYHFPAGSVDLSLVNKLNEKILDQQSEINVLKYNMPLPSYRLVSDVFQTKMQGHPIYGMFDYHFGDQIIYDAVIDKSYICWFMRPERFFNNAVMTYNHATGEIDSIYEFNFDVQSYSADRDYHCRTVMTLLPDGNLMFCTERTHNGTLIVHRTTTPRDIQSIALHVFLGNGAYPKFWQHSSGRMMIAFRVGSNFQYIAGDFSNNSGNTFTERYNIAERAVVAGMRYYSAIPIQVKGDNWHLLIMTRQDVSNNPFGYRFPKFFYLKSTDGGVTWSNVQGTFSKDVKNTSALTEAELTANYMFANIPDADLVSSLELGGACVLPTGQPFILNGVTIFGTYGVKITTYTGGAWVQKTLTIPNVLRYRSLFAVDENTIDIVAIVETIIDSKAYNQAIIYRSIDAGDTWTEREVLTDNPNTPEPIGYMQITNNYDAAKKLLICNAKTFNDFSDLFIKHYSV